MSGQLPHRLVDRVRRFARESWALARLAQNSLLHATSNRTPSSNHYKGWRAACLELTQQEDNRMALNLLKLDKEIHLLRYHGLTNYLKQQQRHPQPLLFSWMQPFMNREALSHPPSSSNNSSSNNNNSSPSSKSFHTTPARAKIPFVITTAMKEDLTRLGYTNDRVKKLTPLKATLLIQHTVKPEELEARLPQLLQQHEQAQMEAQQEALAQAEQERQQHLQEERERRQQEQQQSQQPSDESSTETTPPNQKASSPLSSSVSPKPTWYRVVEEVHVRPRDDNGDDHQSLSSSSIVNVAVGLHKSLEQAQEDCTLRQQLADRNSKEDGAPQRHFTVLEPEPDTASQPSTKDNDNDDQEEPLEISQSNGSQLHLQLMDPTTTSTTPKQ